MQEILRHASRQQGWANFGYNLLPQPGECFSNWSLVLPALILNPTVVGGSTKTHDTGQPRAASSSLKHCHACTFTLLTLLHRRQRHSTPCVGGCSPRIPSSRWPRRMRLCPFCAVRSYPVPLSVSTMPRCGALAPCRDVYAF